MTPSRSRTGTVSSDRVRNPEAASKRRADDRLARFGNGTDDPFAKSNLKALGEDAVGEERTGNPLSPVAQEH